MIYYAVIGKNNLNIECFTTSNKSLMYIKKRMGPSTVPWGKPELTGM